MSSKKKKEKTPAPLPFRSEAFIRDSEHKMERIQRALQNVDEPKTHLPQGESLIEIEEETPLEVISEEVHVETGSEDIGDSLKKISEIKKEISRPKQDPNDLLIEINEDEKETSREEVSLKKKTKAVRTPKESEEEFTKKESSEAVSELDHKPAKEEESPRPKSHLSKDEENLANNQKKDSAKPQEGPTSEKEVDVEQQGAGTAGKTQSFAIDSGEPENDSQAERDLPNNNQISKINQPKESLRSESEEGAKVRRASLEKQKKHSSQKETEGFSEDTAELTDLPEGEGLRPISPEKVVSLSKKDSSRSEEVSLIEIEEEKSGALQKIFLKIKSLFSGKSSDSTPTLDIESIEPPKPIRPQKPPKIASASDTLHNSSSSTITGSLNAAAKSEGSTEAKTLSNKDKPEPVITKPEESTPEQPEPAEEPVERAPRVPLGKINTPEEAELVPKKISSRTLSPDERELRKKLRKKSKKNKKSSSRTSQATPNRLKKKKEVKEGVFARWIKKRREKQRIRHAQSIEQAARAARHQKQDPFWSKLPLLSNIYKNQKAKKLDSANRDSKLFGAIRQRVRAYQSKKASRIWQNIVGLDIGSSHIRAVLVKEGQATLAEREIPDGIIVRGILEEPEELTEEIKALWREEKISSNKVNISFSNRLSVLRVMNIQAESEDDIQQALAVNAEVFVSPMDVDDVVIDYATISKLGQDRVLQITAADQRMVEDFVHAIENSGLVVAGAEIAPLAAGRAVRTPREKGNASIILDIGAEITSFVVASGPDVFYLRILEIGGNDFTKAIGESTHLSWFEAEEWKTTVNKDSMTETDIAANSALQKITDRFCREVAQTVSLYSQSPGAKNIKSVYLAGGGSRVPGLAEQISFSLNQTVEGSVRPIPLFESLPVSFDTWSSAIGLAHNHSMSLLPQRKKLLKRSHSTSKISKEKAAERARKLTRKQAAVGKRKLLLLMFLLGVFLAFLWSQKISMDQEKIEKEAASIESVINSSDSFKEASEAPEKQARLRSSIDQLPEWSSVAEVFRKTEAENLEITQFLVIGQNIEIIFRDNRLPEEIEKVFPGSSVEENPTGDKTMRIEI